MIYGDNLIVIKITIEEVHSNYVKISIFDVNGLTIAALSGIYRHQCFDQVHPNAGDIEKKSNRN